MREIKFRAWDKHSNYMVLPFSLWDVQKTTEMPSSFVGNRGELVLMQYTGLKDKNEKEIYEGDILREPAKDKWEKDSYLGYEVFFHDNDMADNHIGFQMNRIHCYGNLAGGMITLKFLPKHTKKMEVIGNIYENPDLIK